MKNSPNFEDAKTLGEIAFTEAKLKKARDYYQQALELDANVANDFDIPFKIVQTMCYGVRNNEFELEQASTALKELLKLKM